MLKKLVAIKLKFAAKILLFRIKPEVIAVTGSAGKTTTTKLIKEILTTEFDVLLSKEGYNTELGAILALFKLEAPVKTNSISSWLRIIIKSYKYALSVQDYPEKIVVEMGADSPGDIEFLVKTFKPTKGVVLTVLPVHLKDFKSVEDIALEKGRLVSGVRKNGKVFLNCDDKLVKDMLAPKDVKKIFFGTHEKCNIRAENINSDLLGISFDLVEGKDITKIKTMLYGDHMIYPILAAISVARADHISMDKIKKVLLKFKPENGRMNIIEGINESIIIDDSYNANPESTIKALEFLSRQKGRHVSVLGSMNELGDYEKQGHELVGKKASEVSDLIITVGEVAGKYLAESAISSGFSKSNIKSFSDSSEAGKYVASIIKKGDIVLCKGSQNGVRVEKVVRKIMLNKKDAEKILVRQSEFWKKQG